MQTSLSLSGDDGNKGLAGVRFGPALEPEDRLPSAQRWLELAQAEYPTLRLGVEMLRFGDGELKAKVGADPEPYCDLLEAVHGAAERHRAATETLNTIAARLVVALTHSCAGAR